MKQLSVLLLVLFVSGLEAVSDKPLPNSIIDKTLIKHKYDLKNHKKLNKKPPAEYSDIGTITFGYGQLSKVEKKKRMDTLVKILQTIFQYSERNTDDLFYFGRFLDFPIWYDSMNFQLEMGDFLIHVAKIPKRSITRILNILSYHYTANSLNGLFQEHTRQMDSLVKYLVPKEITPLLMSVILLNINRKLPSLDGKKITKNMRRIAKEYFKELKTSIRLKQIIKTGKKFLNLEHNTLAHASADPLFNHSIFYYLFNVEKQILSLGSYYDVSDYLSRNISPIFIANDYETDTLYCKNMVLTRLFYNVNLRDDDKRAFFFQILERFDPQLPFSYYFSSEPTIYNECITDYASYITDASLAIQQKWSSLLAKKDEEYRDFGAFVFKRNNHTLKKHIAKFDSYKENQCEFGSVSESKLETMHDERQRFCKQVEECQDISIKVTLETEEMKDLFHLAKEFCDSEVLRRGIDRFISRESEIRKHISYGLHYHIVDYCLKKAYEVDSLPTECSILKRHSDNNDLRFNIFDSLATERYFLRKEESFIFDLGFPSELIPKSQRVSDLVKYYEGRELLFLEIPGLFKSLSNNMSLPHWETIIWILSRIRDVGNFVEMNFIYSRFAEAIFNYAEQETIQCPDHLFSPSFVTQNLLCFFSNDLYNAVIQFPQLGKLLEFFYERESELVQYKSLKQRVMDLKERKDRE